MSRLVAHLPKGTDPVLGPLAAWKLLEETSYPALGQTRSPHSSVSERVTVALPG